MLDEDLSCATVEAVQPLDDPRFDRPLPLQALVELIHLSMIECLLDLRPRPCQRGQLLAGRGVVTICQIRDGRPFVAHFDFIHSLHRTHSDTLQR